MLITRDNVATPRDGPADGDVRCAVDLVDRVGAGDVGADVVADDGVIAPRREVEHHAGGDVAGDDVAVGGAGSADDVVGRLHDDAAAVVPRGGGAGLVDADPVAGD